MDESAENPADEGFVALPAELHPDWPGRRDSNPQHMAEVALVFAPARSSDRCALVRQPRPCPVTHVPLASCLALGGNAKSRLQRPWLRRLRREATSRLRGSHRHSETAQAHALLVPSQGHARWLLRARGHAERAHDALPFRDRVAVHLLLPSAEIPPGWRAVVQSEAGNTRSQKDFWLYDGIALCAYVAYMPSTSKAIRPKYATVMMRRCCVVSV